MTELEKIKSRCLECRECGLCEKRNHVVFGMGSENAKIMFVGEGPGAQEDAQGLPFVGKSGKLLDKYLAATDLSRDGDIYIANIVKCRPPSNRDPSEEEQEKCIRWLREQVSLIKPEIIVCLGRIAAMRLISPDIRITKDHGRFYSRGKILFMPTFHPSALLRDSRQKQYAFEDFMNLRDKIRELSK